MSKLKMLKFEAATLQDKSDNILKELQTLGAVQLEKTDNDCLNETDSRSELFEFEKKLILITEAMDILKEYGADYGGGMFSGRKAVEIKEFEKHNEKTDLFVGYGEEILSLNKSIAELNANVAKNMILSDTLSSWKNLDIPLGGVSTDYTSVYVGSFPREYTLETLYSEISTALPHINDYSLEIVYSSKLITSVVVVSHKECEGELLSFLRSISFTAPQESETENVSEKLKALSEETDKLSDEINKAREKIVSYVDMAEGFKFTFDILTVKCDEYKALSDVKLSQNTFYFTGYVPEKFAGRLSKVIEKNDGAVVFSSPDENDDVPVLLSNGKFSEPVEGIVEMYAMPGKGDIDPSKLMAFFYYLLFGMMLSDAGYGLLMALGSFLILKFTSVEGGMRRTLNMFVYCGISTLFWGALFGSWFGDAIPVIAREFFGKELGSVALWFDPISDPITLLLFSFVIGICHLFLGLFALLYMKWKDGDKVGAICDTVPIMLTVVGAAPLAAGVLVAVPASVTGIAKYVAIVGVVLIILTSSRSGNVFLRIGGGLYALYNIASGYLSDILSYSRLLALGLATGCIGSVVNMLAVMVKTPVVNVIVFIFVFIVGHSLNMAINVLGAYVHTNRLQFVELFSKFYEGGGRAFNPLTFNTKYFKLKEEIKND